jgi:ABC-type Na+ efflux pump permease subunit
VLVNRNVPLLGNLVRSAAVAADLRLDTAPTNQSISTTVVAPRRRPRDPGELYGPVIAVFFLFLASGFVARGLVSEREGGTFGRLRTIPLSTATIVAGKTVAMIVVAAAEFSIVLATMTLVYHAQWGSLWAVAVVTLALTLAIAAVAVVIASLSNTYQSSAALVAFASLVFVVLVTRAFALSQASSSDAAGVTPRSSSCSSSYRSSGHSCSASPTSAPTTPWRSASCDPSTLSRATSCNA